MRAASTGSSGGANGSLSITTSDSASPRTSTPSQNDCAAEQHRVAERAEARQQLAARAGALHEQRIRRSRSRSRSCARRSARSVVKSRNARPPLAREHRQRGVDHRVGEARVVRARGRPFGQVEQRLVREVERARPAPRCRLAPARARA